MPNAFTYQKTTSLFDCTMQAIKDDMPYIVHCGGTHSSKTYSNIQAIFMLPFVFPGSITTVVAKDIPALKKGVMRDARKILSAEPRLEASYLKLQKTDRIYRDKVNEGIIEFQSFEDVHDARQSGKRDFLFVNEADGISYDVFDALAVRTTRSSIIDFNPTSKFWAHDHIFPDIENRRWFVSNYEHNPYIDNAIIEKILSYEPTPENEARGTANKYKWMVYGLGQLGRLEGLVFPKFDVTNKWPEQYKWRIFGMDFGFSNDPTTLIEVRYSHGELYAKELIFERGLTNPDISVKLNKIGFNKNDLIVADSAEPKSIEELRRRGWNVTGAIKGTDSINQGIDAMKRYQIFIHSGSKNLIEEFSSYQWKENRNGESTNKPVDDFNHGIDAFRYSLTKKLLHKKAPKKRPSVSYSTY